MAAAAHSEAGRSFIDVVRAFNAQNVEPLQRVIADRSFPFFAAPSQPAVRRVRRHKGSYAAPDLPIAPTPSIAGVHIGPYPATLQRCQWVSGGTVVPNSMPYVVSGGSSNDGNSVIDNPAGQGSRLFDAEDWIIHIVDGVDNPAGPGSRLLNDFDDPDGFYDAVDEEEFFSIQLLKRIMMIWLDERWRGGHITSQQTGVPWASVHGDFALLYARFARRVGSIVGIILTLLNWSVDAVLTTLPSFCVASLTWP